MLSLTLAQPRRDGSIVGGNTSEALILHVMLFSFVVFHPEQELENQTAVRKQTLRRLRRRGKPVHQPVLRHPRIDSPLLCKNGEFLMWLK